MFTLEKLQQQNPVRLKWTNLFSSWSYTAVLLPYQPAVSSLIIFTSQHTTTGAKDPSVEVIYIRKLSPTLFSC